MAFNQGLNRVTLAHFPQLPSDFGGTMAHQWLATWGIAEQMQQRMDIAGLPPIPTSVGISKLQACVTYPITLNKQLLQGNQQAQAFAEQMGIALAALVMTLKKAPADARAARPEWPEAHWKNWMNVQQIILGGGVLDGELGRQVFVAATHWIEKLGSGVKLILPARPRNVMLEGLGTNLSMELWWFWMQAIQPLNEA